MFVNLQRAHQYKERFDELASRVEQKLKIFGGPGNAEKQFDVFLSYNWSNSQTTIDSGYARPSEGSVGFGDPRVIKTFLQQHGISVWIDVDQVGRVCFEYICNIICYMF